jgi:hypothetical protein
VSGRSLQIRHPPAPERVVSPEGRAQERERVHPENGHLPATPARRRKRLARSLLRGRDQGYGQRVLYSALVKSSPEREGGAVSRLPPLLGVRSLGGAIDCDGIQVVSRRKPNATGLATMSPRILGGVLLLIAPLSAFAQIPVDYPIVAVSLPQECSETSLVCDMPYSFDSPGTYDFWICPSYEMHLVSAVRFGVVWPAEWVLSESEICYGTVIDGGINGPGDGVTLGLPPNPTPLVPAIRLRIKATTPGRLSLIADPVTGEFAYRGSSGMWWPFFQSDDPSASFFVRIGPLGLCEPPLAPLRCIYCDWWRGRRDPGWIEVPPLLQLPAGVVSVDTLQAWSYECYLSPHCASPDPPGEPCLGSISSNSEWLMFTILEGRIGPLLIEMTVDTRSLGPGTYSTIVSGGTGCGNCGSVCHPVELTVIPLSVEHVSWGVLKATYR